MENKPKKNLDEELTPEEDSLDYNTNSYQTRSNENSSEEEEYSEEEEEELSTDPLDKNVSDPQNPDRVNVPEKPQVVLLDQTTGGVIDPYRADIQDNKDKDRRINVDFLNQDNAKIDFGEDILDEEDKIDDSAIDPDVLFEGEDQFERNEKLVLALASPDIIRISKILAVTYDKAFLRDMHMQMLVDSRQKHKPWMFTILNTGSTKIFKNVHEIYGDMITKLDIEDDTIKQKRERLFHILKVISDPEIAIGSDTVEFKVGNRLLSYFTVLEKRNQNFELGYNEFIVHNTLFNKKMLMRTPFSGRYGTTQDYRTVTGIWKRVSDHPNIRKVYFIQNINEIPCVFLEYIPSTSIANLLSSNSLLFPNRYIWNLSIFLKIVLSVCDAMDYSHGRSSLHLNLKAENVFWTEQDIYESKSYKISNPSENLGIFVSDFGIESILDILGQTFNGEFNYSDFKYIIQFWPLTVKDKLFWLIENKEHPEYDSEHNEFLNLMRFNIDIYTFGGLLLHIASGTASWKDSSELSPSNIKNLMFRNNHYFHLTIYDKIETLIAKCLIVADPVNYSKGFFSFKEIKKSVEKEFGLFIKVLQKNHPRKRKEYLIPKVSSSAYKFVRCYNEYCTNFYFMAVDDALRMMNKANSYAKELGEEFRDILESHKYNTKIVDWILGKCALNDIYKDCLETYTLQIDETEQSYKQIQLESSLLSYINDSKFESYYNQMLRKMMNCYLYNSSRLSKIKIYVSGAKSNIFEVFTSLKKKQIITVCIKNGLKCFDFDKGNLLAEENYSGMTCAKIDTDFTQLIFGDNTGRVMILALNNIFERLGQKKIFQDIANARVLYSHESYVKIVQIAGNGSKACSFDYMDQLLVIYDLEANSIISKTTFKNCISSYIFSNDADVSLLSFENSANIIYWEHNAPTHRWQTKLLGHKSYVYIVDISKDKVVGLSCCLSMNVVFWNLITKTEIKRIRIDDFIQSISTTPYFKYIFIRTSNHVVLYEPKVGIFWHKYKTEIASRSCSIILTHPTFEYLKDGTLSDLHHIHFISRIDPIDYKLEDFQNDKSLGSKAIVSSLDNILTNDYEDGGTPIQDSLQLQNMVTMLRKRLADNLQFRNSFRGPNPYRVVMLYPRNKEGQLIIIRSKSLDLAANFSLDFYANHQSSFVSSNMSNSLNNDLNVEKGSIDTFRQFILNKNVYINSNLHSFHELPKIPNDKIFFKLFNLLEGNENNKILQMKSDSPLQERLRENAIKFVSYTQDFKHLMIFNFDKLITIFSVPKYDISARVLVSISYENRIMLRRMLQTKIEQEDLDALGSFVEEEATPTATALNNSCDQLAIGFANGIIQVFEIKNSASYLLSIVTAHVDYVSAMAYCPTGRLVTGGVDSNVKIWTYKETKDLILESGFIKHSDCISEIKTLPPSPTKSTDWIISADVGGQAFYWNVNSEVATSMFNFYQGGFPALINDELVLSLYFINKSYVMQKAIWKNNIPEIIENRIGYSPLKDEVENARIGKIESDFFAPSGRLI